MKEPSARELLEELLRGNERFASGKAAHPRQDASRRAETAPGQKPFAAVVSCSDSRVPPEIVFDRGIGDLFVVRTAGGVLDSVALGSLEYAFAHLRVSVIVVLGHTRCGAIEAALAGGDPPGHIGAVVEALRPIVERAARESGERGANAARENVRQTVRRLRECEPILAPGVARGSLAVVGAIYDVGTGRVELVDQRCGTRRAGAE